MLRLQSSREQNGPRGSFLFGLCPFVFVSFASSVQKSSRSGQSSALDLRLT
jgi:hypothetical protein